MDVDGDLIRCGRTVDGVQRLHARGRDSVIADLVVAEMRIAGGEFLSVAAIIHIDDGESTCRPILN